MEWIISVSAVGSLKIEYKPTDILVPDQFYDRTRHRADTFFGNGIVGHVSLADPTCSKLSECVVEGARQAGAKVHEGGTYVCMEGPLFSTRAESNAYRSHGWDIIGMTNLQEAKLAREAEMSYATMAMVTDYDCWHEEEDDVSGIAVMEVVQQNVRMAQEALRHVIARVPADENQPLSRHPRALPDHRTQICAPGDLEGPGADHRPLHGSTQGLLVTLGEA